ncbi:MAG: carboxypeptidase regulatory-like domain-containing protein [Bryobacteraceae bacterium]|nr:carboxypeptidase regulatory-like domain-containing protein [Bryobacteraceae bacterium]
MRTTFVLCSAMLLFSTGAVAQIVTGSLSGTVQDPSGLAVSGAKLTLTDNATGRKRVTESSDSGEFIFPGLDAATYQLSVTAPGFKTSSRPGIPLTTGQNVALQAITLELGSVTDTVQVSGQAALVETRSAERAAVITNRQVDNLLVRGRNVTDLVQLVPGVVAGNAQEDLNSNVEFYVQGNRRTANNVSIDGVPATDMGNGFQLKQNVSQDAVAEVRILVSNYQAEFGRMAGSNLQVVTKSGSRDFHGLGSYFKRHEQFNANNFFNNRDGLPVPKYRFNTWTYNVSGPVYIPKLFNPNREKLFFFWGQEFWPTRLDRNGRVTVPTELEREGNYSQSLDLNNRLVVVRDPQTNAPFPGNIVPAGRIDPSGRALLRMFPVPNALDRNVTRGNYNYVFAAPINTPKRTNTLKVDYNASTKDTVTVSLNMFREDQTGSIGIPSAGGMNWPMMVKTWGSHPNSITARYTRVITPHLLNEFSFGWLSQPADDTYEDAELEKIKASNVGFVAGALSPAANPLGVIPNASFGGVTGAANLTVEGRFPLYNRYHLGNWADNITWNRGSHNFKAGVYIERFFRNQKKTVPFNGSIDFGRNVNNPLDTNYAYTNAILGNYGSYTEISGPAFMNIITMAPEWFVQDTWRATKRLTVDIGMRFYIIPPLLERDNLLAGFDPSFYDPAKRTQLVRPGLNATGARIAVNPVTGQQLPAALIGAIASGAGDPFNGMVKSGTANYPRALINNQGVQYGPRVGLAWDPFGDGKTSIRTGFGMFYNRYFTETFLNPLMGQPPLLQTPVITYGTLGGLRSANRDFFPSNVFAADVNSPLPRIMNFSFSIQRDIGGGVVVDLGYAGSLGRHLFWRRDINAIPLGANFDARNFDPTTPGRPLPASFLRPYTGFNNIQMMEGAGSSNYHSMQLQVKRRFRRGLDFNANWTWSRSMDYNSNDTDTVSAIVPVRVWNYGPSTFDRTHVVNVSYIYDLPGVRTTNAIAKQVLHGWQLSGITNVVSGAPLGIGLATVNAFDVTGSASQGARPDITGSARLDPGERTFSRNFRTEVFRMPAAGTIGNSEPSPIRGPGYTNFDLALFKAFPIRESVRMQLRWELYNAFNHTQFSAIDTTARFDTATGQQVNARFGEFIAARNPRQMQFALRFYF